MRHDQRARDYVGQTHHRGHVHQGHHAVTREVRRPRATSASASLISF
jgi:hypothetical protein